MATAEPGETGDAKGHSQHLAIPQGGGDQRPELRRGLRRRLPARKSAGGRTAARPGASRAASCPRVRCERGGRAGRASGTQRLGNPRFGRRPRGRRRPPAAGRGGTREQPFTLHTGPGMRFLSSSSAASAWSRCFAAGLASFSLFLGLFAGPPRPPRRFLLVAAILPRRLRAGSSSFRRGLSLPLPVSMVPRALRSGSSAGLGRLLPVASLGLAQLYGDGGRGGPGD